MTQDDLARLLPSPTADSYAAPVWGQANGAIGARDLARELWARKMLIAGVTVLFALIGLVLASILPKYYTAEGLLVVNLQEVNIPDFQTIRSQGTVEPWGARSAAQILNSREIVQEAAERLSIAQDPAFVEEAEVGRVDHSAEDHGGEQGRKHAHDADWNELIRKILRKLVVFSEERSYAIRVAFTWTDPDAAARFVNGLMKFFVDREIAVARQTMAEASERLEDQLRELHDQLAATEAQVRKLENSKDLLVTLEGTVLSQRLVLLVKEQETISNDIANIRSDLEQVTSALRSGNANLLNPEFVSPRLRALLQAQAQAWLSERTATGISELGPKHPQRLEIKEQLENLEGQIMSEMKAIRSSLEQRLESLNERGDVLGAQIGILGDRAATAASKRTELEQLRSEATSQRRLYDTYQERYRQTLANMEVLQPGIRIAAMALPPARPSSPGRTLLAVIGAVLGFCAAIGGILAVRWWRGRAESLRDLSELSGLPALGALPRVGATRRNNRLAAPGSVAEQLTHGPITETMRGILFRLRDNETPVPKVILISSGLPGEGKTSFALSMVRVAAHDGLRSLCIDADLRNPSLAKRAGIDSGIAIDDYILGRADFDDLVVPDRVSDASLVLARLDTGHPLRLVTHTRFGTLISEARRRYDLIVVDTPPVLRVVDPLVVARLADRVILVVSPRGAAREVLAETIDRFSCSPASLGGVVMVQSSARMQKIYSYSGY